MDDISMLPTTRPIGVFDSGCGGLTVLRVLQSYFPHENFVYYADTAHLPYGTKSPEEIHKYTYNALTWLQNVAQVKLIVVACHTSSAIALETVRSHFEIPIIGTIYPLVETIIKNNTYQKIGIIATPASAHSGMHRKVLYAHGFNGIVESIACPLFVPLIEAPTQNIASLTAAACEYLQPFYTQCLDTLVYGCTHYPLIAPIIKNVLPTHIQYIDPAYAIADAVVSVLHNVTFSHSHAASHGTTQYYCSGDKNIFSLKIKQIMHNTTTAQHIPIQ
jgi:glutamate racemase